MTSKKIPEIRFAGFAEDWELRKVSEIFTTVSDKGYSNLPVLSASQEFGMIRRDEIGIDIKYDENSTKNYKRVRPGQFVIHLRSFQGGFAWSNIDGITSPAYTILDYKYPNQQTSTFWKEVLTSQTFIKRLETVTYGIRDGRSISFKDFSTLNFNVPNIDEQKQIGEFFSKLDELITLHQRELEALKDTKSGFLQRMFPKDGKDVPEIRLPGFTEDWEQRKLEKLATFSKGQGYTKSDLSATGFPILLYGRLYTNYELIINSVDTFVTDDSNAVISTGNEVVVPSSGESAEDISRASFISANDIILGGDLNIIKPKDEILPIFLALTISNGSAKNDMRKRAQGKSVVHLHNSDLKEIQLLYPNIHEQKQIGEFFSNLDELITLHQSELENLQDIKKAFLQKMFV